MRIITTWMYFDPSQIEGETRRRRFRSRDDVEPEPGIGIAWYGGDATDMMAISNLKIFRELPGRRDDTLNENLLRDYVDGFLSDGENYDFIRNKDLIRNTSIVDFVLQEPFVIERSPPVHLSLKGIVTSTNLPVWIGTYMGWNVAPEHSVLLFVTVPGGIIVVSSAVGLAGALASGLGTSIKRLFR